MREFFAIIAIFSSLAAWAATPEAPKSVADGRAPSSTVVTPCSSFAESGVRGEVETKYIRRIEEWSRNEGVLSSHFAVPFAWVNRQIVLHIGAATGGYSIELNGKIIGNNRTGILPADFVITKQAKEGRNDVRIIPYADESEGVLSPAAEEFMVRGVRVQSPAPVRVRDLVVATHMSPEGGALAEFGVVMKSEMLNRKQMRVYYELLARDSVRLHYGFKDISLDMRREDTVRFAVRVPDSCLWRLRDPQMLRLDIKTQNNGRYLEYHTFRLGVRTVEVDERGLIAINGKPAGLIVVAEAAPDITAEEIAALRKEGYNTIHPRLGALSPELYRTCDSIGMFVIAPATISTERWGDSRRVGGNPSNDPAWRDAYVDRAVSAYHALKLHPSVIAFTYAVNSSNGICLYETYLKLKSFGDSRPMLYDAVGGEWNSDRLRRFHSPEEAGIKF